MVGSAAVQTGSPRWVEIRVLEVSTSVVASVVSEQVLASIAPQVGMAAMPSACTRTRRPTGLAREPERAFVEIP